jgi:AcrR family transcriptional regulator
MAGRPRDSELDARIRDAALELLAERGYARTTFELVAERAGAQRSAIYRRYACRSELACHAVRAALADANPIAPHTADPAADLRVVLQNLIQQLTRSALGGALRALIPELARDAALQRLALEVQLERRRILIELLERVQESGRLRVEARPVDAVEFVLGPIYFRWLFGTEKLTPGYARKLVDAVCRPR